MGGAVAFRTAEMGEKRRGREAEGERAGNGDGFPVSVMCLLTRRDSAAWFKRAPCKLWISSATYVPYVPW